MSEKNDGEVHCPGCGAPLRVAASPKSFPCALCGERLLASPSGRGLSVRRLVDAVRADPRPADKDAARLALARLESEAVAAYEEFDGLHAAAWEEHTRHSRLERHRQDLEFAAAHPVRAWFAREARERMRHFERAMRSEGAAGMGSAAFSLETVRDLEARAAESAGRLREALAEAESRWESLQDQLDEARVIANA